MKNLLFLILSASCFAQDVTTMANLVNLMRKPPVNFLTVTATQGDGSILSFAKIAGPTIQISVTGSGLSQQTVQGSSAINGYMIRNGSAMCFILANTGTTVIPAQGAWPAIPANGIAAQCTTDIISGGAFVGGTPVVTAVQSWP